MAINRTVNVNFLIRQASRTSKTEYVPQQLCTIAEIQSKLKKQSFDMKNCSLQKIECQVLEFISDHKLFGRSYRLRPTDDIKVVQLLYIPGDKLNKNEFIISESLLLESN